jgi:hypothetical protein
MFLQIVKILNAIFEVLSWFIIFIWGCLIEQALLKNATEAMKESRVFEILSSVCSLQTSEVTIISYYGLFHDFLKVY